jgi:hypothetical protein
MMNMAAVFSWLVWGTKKLRQKKYKNKGRLFVVASSYYHNNKNNKLWKCVFWKYI